MSAEPCHVTSSGAKHVSIKPSDDSSPSHWSGHQPFVFPPAVMEQRQTIISTRKWLLLYAVTFRMVAVLQHDCNSWIRSLSLPHGFMKSQRDCWGPNPQGGRARSGADSSKLWLHKQPSGCPLHLLPWSQAACCLPKQREGHTD